MPVPTPNLDDRTFEDLMAAARQKLAGISHDQWTDLSPGDPGIVLLELFGVPDRDDDLPAESAARKSVRGAAQPDGH